MTLGSAVLAFGIVAAAVTVIPGPDTALVLRAALTGRRSEALATGAGIVAGLFVWGAAAAVGVSALLTASEVGYEVLRYAGTAYLMGLGVRLLARAARPVTGIGDAGAPFARAPWRAACTGLTTNLLNPKVGVFYLAVLPQFVPGGDDPLAVGLLLAAVHGALSMLWFLLLAHLAGVLARRLRRPSTARMIDAVTGTALLGAAGGLALGGR